MQAAGLVLHICGGDALATNANPFGKCVGEYTKRGSEWHTPFGNLLAVDPELESVPRPARDYCEQRIEDLDPNQYTCLKEQNIHVYRPDIQELNFWNEEPEQLKTIPRSDKQTILKALGSAETHGESFPTCRLFLKTR